MSLELLGISTGQALLVRVKNPGALAASQAGTSGAIAAALLPETINNQVLTAVKAQLQDKLAQNGVLADIEIVDDTGSQATLQSDLFGGIAIGGVAVAAIWGITHFLFRR